MEEISNLVSIGRFIDEMRFSVGEATLCVGGASPVEKRLCRIDDAILRYFYLYI
jgi:hypothetical protein